MWYEVHQAFEHKYYRKILCVLWTQKMTNGSIRNELDSWKDGCWTPELGGNSTRTWEKITRVGQEGDWKLHWSTRGLDTPWLKLGESHSVLSCECCHVLKRICDHFIYPLTPTTYDVTRFEKNSRAQLTCSYQTEWHSLANWELW